MQGGFSAIAHIFKFLWRHMLRDIENVYRLFRTLPPLHRPPLPLPLPLLYAFHPSPPPPSLPPPQSLFRAPGSVAEIAHTTVCCRKLWISPQEGLSIDTLLTLSTKTGKTFVRLETRRSFWEWSLRVCPIIPRWSFCFSPYLSLFPLPLRPSPPLFLLLAWYCPPVGGGSGSADIRGL